MENTSNRLSSAKWSRNLNEDSQTDANRLRLLERQRQMLETKLQRRQNPTATSAVVASRPATSIAGVRARVSRQSFSDGQSDGSINVNTSNAEFETIIRDVTEHCETIPTTTRARTSIAANRKLTNVDSPSKSTSGNDNRKSIGNNGSSNYNNNNNNNPATNSPLTNRQQTPIRTNLRDLRSLSRSEANITVTRGQDILSKVAKTGTELLTPNPLTTVLSDEELLNFVTQPISPKVTLQCTIIRDKKGLDRTMFPTYFMHLQDIIINHQPGTGGDVQSVVGSKANVTDLRGTATISMSDSVDSLESIKSNEDDDSIRKNETKNSTTTGTSTPSGNEKGNTTSANSNSNRKVFVLSGRKRKKAKTYLIGNNAFDISRDRCLAKLKSNVLGTQFTAIRLQQNGVRYEIASITYETNVLGFRGPRKMGIIIPKTDEKTNVLCNLSLQEELRRNSRAIIVLKNKTPIWNEETQSYVLNFHGRVTQASVKNFQLVIQEQMVTRPKTGNTISAEMRRSASSHQLRQRYSTTDSGMESSLNNNDDDDDEDEEEDEEESDDETTAYGTSTHVNEKEFATTRPMSKSLSKSGYLSANTSEDAKTSLAGDANEIVSLQFGRVSNTQFSCDVSWPLSLLQAFAIALSSFDNKIACE